MQVLEARKKVMGFEHPDMLTSLTSTYGDHTRLKEVEELEL